MNAEAQVLLAESPIRRWWRSRSFIQKRLIRFCMSMLVMVICFPLYYAGLFGTVEGPLSPGNIGQTLAGMGVTRTHSMLVFLSLFIIAMSWNWIFNLVSLIVGSRLTCTRPNAAGQPCGAPAVREKLDRKAGAKHNVQYVCAHGHKRPEAHFHPVRKGTLSHTVWAVSLIFCVIVLASTYL